MSVFSIELVQTGREKKRKEKGKKESKKKRGYFQMKYGGRRGMKRVCGFLCTPAESCGRAWEPPR